MDLIDLARAEGALALAWGKIEPDIRPEQREEARADLANIVASFAMIALDEKDLAYCAVRQFRSNVRGK